jgi:hypothetical protein
MGRKPKPFLPAKSQNYYSGDCEGETALWRAVLEQSAADYYGIATALEFRDNAEKIQADAQQWFESESCAVGTFRWLANLLCLNPNWLKRRILQDARPRIKTKNEQVKVLRRNRRTVVLRPRRYQWADLRLAFMLGWFLGRRSNLSAHQRCVAARSRNPITSLSGIP